jgi:glycerol-3-phosphate dehydrogenase
VSVVPFDRGEALQRLADERFDVLVIGGGITGCGVALDAATRGLRTALVERDDFASGTSSKSSKLVHGGLRYLQQRELGLVREGLAERQVVLRNAPHLVRPLPFLIPLFARGGVINPKIARALGWALWMYDLAGGLRIGHRHDRISADEALARMPTLARERMAGAYLYYDARADDARLTLAIARTAAAQGAAVANHAGVVGLRKLGGRVQGARIALDGAEIDVRASAVVNAAGVWADDVRALDEGANPKSLRPAKGIHVTVPWEKLRNDIAVVVPVPKDRRSIFVVPWGDRTYIGTTDTDYEGPLDDPRCTPDDIAYLLDAVNRVVTDAITPADVIGTWAGLRPLRRAGDERTADLSRKHAVNLSYSGVVTVTGGKLTTYRRMAADAVDAVLRDPTSPLARGRKRRSRTKRLRLVGADAGSVDGDDADGLDHLAGRYGSEAEAVRELADADPSLSEPLVAGLPYLRAEAVFAVRHEMARTLDDVLTRRTRARLMAADASAAAAGAVARLLAPELGWDDDECRRQRNAFQSAVAADRDAAGLPEHALDASLGA